MSIPHEGGTETENFSDAISHHTLGSKAECVPTQSYSLSQRPVKAPLGVLMNAVLKSKYEELSCRYKGT